MIHQIPISLKLNANIYADLQFELQVCAVNRNRFINNAVNAYIRIIEARRQIGCHPQEADVIKSKLADELIKSIYFYK